MLIGVSTDAEVMLSLAKETWREKTKTEPQSNGLLFYFNLNNS